MKSLDDYHQKKKIVKKQEKETKVKEKNKKQNNNKWIYYIFLITFVLSLVFGGASSILIENLNIAVATILLVIIIAIGIAFDMIGMSVVSADEAVFHARAAKKHKGAKEAVKLVKFQDKVSSVCNDVVGDVCGVISGSLSAMLALKVAGMLDIDAGIVTLIFGAIVASLTVGGKAIEKSIIIKHSNTVIYFVGKIIYYITPNKDKFKKEEMKK